MRVCLTPEIGHSFAMPSTIRALVVSSLSDDYSGCTVQTLPLPEPKPGEARVAIKAAAVNFPDLLMTQGKYQLKPDLPFTPGSEFAGIVDAVGNGVDPAMIGSEVIGGIRDTTYHAELLALAERLGIRERVSFTGELSAADVSRRLWESDAALLPFATGASTGRSTLMAALAHGLPVVTTCDPANLPLDFRDGENLLLAPVGSEAAFIAATRRVAQDAPLRARLSHGARHLSETVFAWPIIARQTLALPAYRNVGR